MTNHSAYGGAGMVPAIQSWSQQTNLPSIMDEDNLDADEPPDPQLPYSPIKSDFHRNPIRRSVDMHHQSLLTKALHSPTEEEPRRIQSANLRRGTTSTASLASTADLTSDTGLTSPSRTNTPSPPIPELQFLNLNGETPAGKQAPTTAPAQKPAAPKKRCIQFACASKPNAQSAQKSPQQEQSPQEQDKQSTAASTKTDQTNGTQRKTCIKFACPAPQTAKDKTSPRRIDTARLSPAPTKREVSPATLRKPRKSSSQSRSPRPPPARRSSRDPSRKPMKSKKYISVDDQELQHDAARFHEFASDEHCDEDWVRESVPSQGRKMTIDDTLAKENEIRKIAAEAEAEAEMEEEEEEDEGEGTATDGEDDEKFKNTPGLENLSDEDEDDEDEEDEDEDDDDDEDDDLSGYITEDDEEEDDSVGYHTDEETGFADSEDENDDLQLWTPAQPALRLSGATPVARLSSANTSQPAQESDSSVGSMSSVRAVRSGKVRRIKIRPGTPELPDSTDFVCGTLDEDRALEDAYISRLEARRKEKMHPIPQDIDPSFPASDLEDAGDEDRYNPVKHSSDDEDDLWLHGKMDDIHHDHDRKSRGKKKKDHQHSPKRYHSPPPKKYHSPPPKRHHSPPPKGRGRSPAPTKKLFDRRSPRRIASPPPNMLRSPPASLRQGSAAVQFKELASRPGLTMTKSLPRPPALFLNQVRNGGRRPKAQHFHSNDDVHVRSAIDIVKGLEQKRQRRKEKFYQKHCNRARKGQVAERRPMPGMGCERMRELGLLMAGKTGQGNYVLSI